MSPFRSVCIGWGCELHCWFYCGDYGNQKLGVSLPTLVLAISVSEVFSTLRNGFSFMEMFEIGRCLLFWVATVGANWIRLSIIYREIKRNSTPNGNYLWDKAHEKAIARRKRSSANSKLLYISYSLIYGYSYLRLALIWDWNLVSIDVYALKKMSILAVF